MAGPRQPTGLVIAKGKKHLTKDEIQERLDREVQGCTDEIVAPSFLSAAQKKEFNRIAQQLLKIKIMAETDCDALGRYVVAQALYVQAVKDLQTVQKQQPKMEKGGDPQDFALATLSWANALEALDKRVDRYFKQAQTAAAALGLTISHRCKLVVPVKDEAPKVNKFSKFAVIEGTRSNA